MSLIQINEPEGRPAADSAPRRHAAGMDLGTTNSVVATVVDGRAQTPPDENGRRPPPPAKHEAANP